MGPDLDVYAVSTARDAETVRRLLDAMVDRKANETRGDEQLMILPLGAQSEPSNAEDWEWQPARSLSHIVECGVSLPHRAFAVYLTPSDATIDRVILAFTTDGQLVAGVSVRGAEAGPEALSQAKALLHRLARLTDAHSGFIGVETRPPLHGRIPDQGESIPWVWRRDNAV